MTQTSEDAYAFWDAAYVLGALPPAERREYEEHLSGCAACSAKVAEVASLPGLLAAAGPESPTVQPVRVPPYAVFARKVRRRRAGWVAATAAAVLIAGAGTVALNLPQGGPVSGPTGIHATAPAPTGQAIALHFTTTGQRALTASGHLQGTAWGTQITWTCTYAPGQVNYPVPAQNYELVVHSTTGKSTVVASWLAGPGETVSPVATSSLAPKEIAGVEIRLAGAAQPLLQATP